MSMMRASKVGFLGCLKAPHPRVSICRRRIVCRRTLRPLHAKQVQEQEIEQVDDKTEALTEEPEVERVTKKWGLEAGLWKAVTGDKNQNKRMTATELLKKYGSAYLITSITFAIMSFAICYVLVDFGVDVAALLAKIGINVSGASEKVGTAAIAYAAHKAASPIRFPPTVALTPVVANWLGQKRDESKE